VGYTDSLLYQSVRLRHTVVVEVFCFACIAHMLLLLLSRAGPGLNFARSGQAGPENFDQCRTLPLIHDCELLNFA